MRSDEPPFDPDRPHGPSSDGPEGSGSGTSDRRAPVPSSPRWTAGLQHLDPRLFVLMAVAMLGFFGSGGSVRQRLGWAVGAVAAFVVAPVVSVVVDRVVHWRSKPGVVFRGRADFLVEDVRFGPLSAGIPQALQASNAGVLRGVLSVTDDEVRWVPGRRARRQGASVFVLPWRAVDSAMFGYGPLRGWAMSLLELHVGSEWSASFRVKSGPVLARSLAGVDQRMSERIAQQEADGSFIDEGAWAEGDAEQRLPASFWESDDRAASELPSSWRWATLAGWCAVVTVLLSPSSSAATVDYGLLVVLAASVVSIGMFVSIGALLAGWRRAFVVSAAVGATGAVLSFADIATQPGLAVRELLAFGTMGVLGLMANGAMAHRDAWQRR